MAARRSRKRSTADEVSDWEQEMARWMAPFLAALGHKGRRRWAPVYLHGLLGPGDRKSVQPMAARIAPADHEQLHHFIATSAWDPAPLETALAREADEDTLRQHLRAHPMAATPWRHVADTWALYNPSTITPLFVVVDADGRIRGIEPGARALAYLAAELRALIDESGTLPSSRH